MGLLYDPEHARQFVRHGEGLERLAGSMSDVVTGLTDAGRRMAERLDEHVEELERSAELPADAVADRLDATVDRARQMAAEMNETLNGITAQAARAAQGIGAMARELTDVRDRALLDALTRVHSHLALFEHLEAMTRAGDAAGPWCFALIAVDALGGVHEDHGHIVADALLYKVARTVEDAVPADEPEAVLGRYGADAFGLILRSVDAREARALAERVRSRVEATRWQLRDRPGAGVVRVMVSAGIAEHCAGDTAVRVVSRAEQALAEAREAGGNAVV